MDDRLPERTAAVLDSASTWHGVTWTTAATGTEELRLDGRVFGRVTDDTVTAAFPGRVSGAAVRHGFADDREGDGWVSRPLDSVPDGVALLRLAYLSHLARLRRRRSAYPAVDIDDALAELDPLPGLVHLVRELRR